MKKFLAVFLSMVMMFSLSVTAFAQSPVEAEPTVSASQYTVDDVKALEPYISVENGRFIFDTDAASDDGVPSDLINGQTAYLQKLNTQAANGEIAIADDLSITSLTPSAPMTRAGHWASCGGGKNTATTNHWWGYSRYACDCETNRMSADFNSCASVAAGVGVVGAYFGAVGAIPGGLSSAYWWLLASRLDANNHGHGVYVEMTWVLVFDITPQ